jgi:hypothetical protein
VGRWALGGTVVILLGLLFLSSSLTICWVGGTNLEIEFVITDAVTGQRVPNAAIVIHSEGGFYLERDDKDFTMRTALDGTAKRVCHEAMCFGTNQEVCGITIKETFCVHLPRWTFQISAPGYEVSESMDLDGLGYQRAVRGVKTVSAKLVVPVALNPAGPRQGEERGR